ncbi:MAG: hypothetical protein IKC83_02210 [Clostridia bacterium]|nr:hypothetical protein [Clostridia bacterium]
MRKYFCDYVKRYDETARESLVNAFDLVCSDDFLNLVQAYSDNINFDYKSCMTRVSEIGEKVGVHEYQSKFVYCLCLTEKMKEYYVERGYSEEFFDDNIKDFDYKLEECKLVKGIYGTFCPEWFEGHFKLTRFKLGRLQFEIKRLNDFIPGIAQYEKGDLFLDGNSPMINVHIPRSGERLDEDLVKDAFSRANTFYRREFKNRPVVFCCESWLLYPRNAELMKEGSNLKKFYDLFDIVASGEYDTYQDCWRLFDMDYTGSVDDLPGDSSLRRAYKELMKKGEKTGWGFGIHIYEK